MVYTIFFRLAQLLFLAALITTMAKEVVFLSAQLESALWHLFGLAVCGAVCTSSLSLFKESFRKIQYVRNTPISNIDAVKQGYVKLKGILQPIQQQELLLSSLSHTPCLWFDYLIERYSSTKTSSSTWTTVDSDQSNAAFCLVDDSGQCHINPQDADITAHHNTKIWQGNQPHPQRCDQPSRWQKRVSSSNRYRYTEWFLLPNQTLYTLGYLHNKNGQLILEKPPDGRPFVLSDQEESKVIGSSRFNAIAGAVICFISALIAIVIIWHWLR